MSMIAPFRHDTPFHPPVPAPRASGLLGVGDEHRIYWEETGPSDGCPVIVLHGGPGGSIRPYYRRLLDPGRHRGILFDQRGCGKSQYSDPLAANTIDTLAQDMEALRVHLGIERWIVCGGSWGSTLALHYAETHPDRTAGLVVSGIFLGRETDLHWWWHGARHIFPDVYDARDKWLPPAERTDPRKAFRNRILGDDPDTAGEAARMLVYSETQLLDPMPPAIPDDPYTVDDALMSYARVFAHYDAHDFFVGNNRILANAGRLAGIPGAIISGRGDMCTPPGGAWDLHQAWPDARLHLIANAGHRWNDAVLGLALVPEISRVAEDAFGAG